MTGAIHGTAVVAGTLGLLIVGPSGAGKSRLALALIAEARRRGEFGALIADDRVFLERHGAHVLARRPESIADLLEIRGSGIGRIPSLEKAVLHVAVMAFSGLPANRLPPDGEVYDIGGGIALPLLHLSAELAAPLTALRAIIASRSARQS